MSFRQPWDADDYPSGLQTPLKPELIARPPPRQPSRDALTFTHPFTTPSTMVRNAEEADLTSDIEHYQNILRQQRQCFGSGDISDKSVCLGLLDIEVALLKARLSRIKKEMNGDCVSLSGNGDTGQPPNHAASPKNTHNLRGFRSTSQLLFDDPTAGPAHNSNVSDQISPSHPDSFNGTRLANRDNSTHSYLEEQARQGCSPTDSVLSSSHCDDKIKQSSPQTPHFAQHTQAFKRRARRAKNARPLDVSNVFPVQIRRFESAKIATSNPACRRQYGSRPALPHEWISGSSESRHSTKPSPSGPSYMTPTRSALNRQAKSTISNSRPLAYAKPRATNANVSSRDVFHQSADMQQPFTASFLQEATSIAEVRLSPERQALIRLALHRCGVLKTSHFPYPETALMPKQAPGQVSLSAEEDPFIDSSGHADDNITKVEQPRQASGSSSTASSWPMVLTSPKRALSFVEGSEALHFTVQAHQDNDNGTDNVYVNEVRSDNLTPLRPTAETFTPNRQAECTAANLMTTSPSKVQSMHILNAGQKAPGTSAEERWNPKTSAPPSLGDDQQPFHNHLNGTGWNHPHYETIPAMAQETDHDELNFSDPAPAAFDLSLSEGWRHDSDHSAKAPWSFNDGFPKTFALNGASLNAYRSTLPRPFRQELRGHWLGSGWQVSDGREIRFRGLRPPQETDPNLVSQRTKHRDAISFPRSQQQWAEWLSRGQAVWGQPVVC